MTKLFDIVVAHDLNLGIGKNNAIPWHLPTDLAYFKKLTTSSEKNKRNAVIMGRNTWESLPDKFKPLPNRHNVVVSKTLTSVNGAIIADSLDNSLETVAKLPDINRIFIIGGTQLYTEALQHKLCNTLYITKVFSSFDCDTYFPNYKSEFNCCYASNIWVSKTANCAFFQYIKNNT